MFILSTLILLSVKHLLPHIFPCIFYAPACWREFVSPRRTLLMRPRAGFVTNQCCSGPQAFADSDPSVWTFAQFVPYIVSCKVTCGALTYFAARSD